MIMGINTVYVPAIEVNLRDAFPGEKVHVWTESSFFKPNMIAVMARVGNYGACVSVDMWQGISEVMITDELIRKILGIMHSV